jgi:hypothetical protein
MTNYPYLIASLPDFQPDCEPHPFDHAALVAFLKANCPARDARRIDWLEAGLEPAHLGHLFYAGVARSRCRFLREFFAFDRRVREAKVAFLAGEPLPDGPVEERAQLEGLFAVKNILEREKQWDRLYWQKADELTQFNLFDIDVVLAFLVKAHTVARWNALDPVHGAELFSQLVNEVRGTFSGVNYDPNTP